MISAVFRLSLFAVKNPILSSRARSINAVAGSECAFSSGDCWADSLTHPLVNAAPIVFSFSLSFSLSLSLSLGLSLSHTYSLSLSLSRSRSREQAAVPVLEDLLGCSVIIFGFFSVFVRPDTQRTRPNCKHLGIQINCTRRVPWSEMVASARRKAPTLEEEYRLFPSLLASKIFPLRAEDCLVRDIRVWHGGCPNLSGEARFLPSIEVSSAAWAEWRRTCMASSIYIDRFPRSITLGGSSTRTIRSILTPTAARVAFGARTVLSMTKVPKQSAHDLQCRG